MSDAATQAITAGDACNEARDAIKGAGHWMGAYIWSERGGDRRVVWSALSADHVDVSRYRRNPTDLTGWMVIGSEKVEPADAVAHIVALCR